MTATASLVRNVHPPQALGRVFTPTVRAVVRSPLGRFMRFFSVLEVTGRRTGRLRRIVVGWHMADGRPVLFTPAGWRANFADGPVEVTVRHRGRAERWVATLERDPQRVAALLRGAFEAGTKPRLVNLAMPPNHELTAADVAAVDRAAILLAPAPE